MKLEDFDYPLPKELIAQEPLAKRDASRLLVIDRQKKTLENKLFSDIVDYVPAGDVLVLNDTKVFPARLLGKKKLTGGRAELLLLGAAQSAAAAASATPVWRCLVQPSLKAGQEIVFPGSEVSATFEGRDKDGTPLVAFHGTNDVESLAQSIGSMPLPPYIKREPSSQDAESYQTVYANRKGAVASPTAGLHFTKELLDKIRARGVRVLFVTLHVGYGTFKPVEDLENHQMHEEFFEVPKDVAEEINKAHGECRKIWAVGTTTLRALETCVQNKKLIPGNGSTNLYIRDPFEFEATDRLVTNFHLPKTTLLLLVSAFMGETLRKKAYEHAIKERYRFYSYGDSMLII